MFDQHALMLSQESETEIIQMNLKREQADLLTVHKAQAENLARYKRKDTKCLFWLKLIVCTYWEDIIPFRFS